MHSTVTTLLIFIPFLALAVQEAVGQSDKKSTWQSYAEPRPKSIYEHGDFRVKHFSSQWLDDSSGFLVDEIEPITNKDIKFFYDSKTGERRPAAENQILNGSNIGRNSADREIEFRNPVWSPDRSKVLFVEADFSDVRQRHVLVPGDASYPEVQPTRFARVGGDIETLRIGVVNKDGKELTWLPMDCPEEGVYLGQVEWAGNAKEVLVERFS